MLHTQKKRKFEIQKAICFHEHGETNAPSIGGEGSPGAMVLENSQDTDFAESPHMIWQVARPISLGHVQ